MVIGVFLYLLQLCMKCENWRKEKGGYSNALYIDEDTEQILRSIDFSNLDDYNKLIDYVINNLIKLEENLSREGNERNSR